MTDLSLTAKTFLLAYDPNKQNLIRKRYLGTLLRGAVLTELAIAGLVADSGGKAVASATSPPADPLLADAFAEIRGSRSSWRSLVRRHGATYSRVRDVLVERGVIRISGRRALGVAPVEQIIPVDPHGVAALRAHVAGVLCGTVPVHEVAREDAALVGLASAGGLLRNEVSFGERSRNRSRVKALSALGGEAVTAVGTVIELRRAALIASTGGTHGA